MNPSHLISKQLWGKDFSMEQLPTDSDVTMSSLSRRFPTLVWDVWWCAMSIFLFLKFCNFIKRFCADIHIILSRTLFLYSTYELVQIFITFNRFVISFFPFSFVSKATNFFICSLNRWKKLLLSSWFSSIESPFCSWYIKMYLLKACKLDWEGNLSDFYEESIAFRIEILINAISS